MGAVRRSLVIAQGTVLLMLLGGLLSPVAAQVDIGPGTVTGAVETGPFLNPVPYTDVGKSRQYHDMAQQWIVPELKALFDDKENRYYADLYMLNTGQTNQLFNLRAGIYGLLDIQAQYVSMPDFLSYDRASSPYVLQGRDFNLPNYPGAPVPGQPAGENIASWLSRTASPLPLSLLWGIANLHVSYTPSPWWTYSLYFNFQDANGHQPMGELFGPNPGSYNVTQLYQPVSYYIYNYGTGVEYANPNWSLGFKYDGSFFRNPDANLTWQNPDVWGERTGPGGACANSATYSPGSGTGPCLGKTQVEPDNQAHMLTLTGGLNLPYNTHAMGTVSYGWWLQDMPFIPFTTNTALPSQALPQSNLGGDVTPFFGNFSLAGHPTEKFQYQAVYSYYDYANHTSPVAFNNIASLNDVASPWSAVAFPFSFSDQNIELTASYLVTPTLAFRLVGLIDTYHTNGLEVLQQNMTSYGPVIDWNPYPWMMFRASYQHGFRDSPGYSNNRSTLLNQNAGSSELSDLARFYDATVQINQYQLYWQAQPFRNGQPFEGMPSWLEPLTLIAEFDYDNYFYPASTMGTQNWSDYSPSVGLSYEVAPFFSFFGDFGWEATDMRMLSMQRQPHGVIASEPNCPGANPNLQSPGNCPAQIWSEFGRQQGTSVDLGFDINIPRNFVLPKPSRLRVMYTYALTSDLNHMFGDSALTPAANFPMVNSQFQELIVDYSYQAFEHGAANIGLYFSHFGENDFGYDSLVPWMGAASPYSTFLANSNWIPFNAFGVYTTFRYVF